MSTSRKRAIAFTANLLQEGDGKYNCISYYFRGRWSRVLTRHPYFVWNSKEKKWKLKMNPLAEDKTP